jgi:hypothetical protein
MKIMRNPLRLSILAVAAILFLAGCTSMTQIQTIPPGAKVYLNDEFGGESPCTMSDSKIIGSTTYVRIEKPGYYPLETVIVRTEEIDAAPVVCGLIFTPIWWLWAMKYKPVHLYELVPLEQ